MKPLPLLFLFLSGASNLPATTIEEALAIAGRWEKTIQNERLVPHWLADGESFWYRRETRDAGDEYVLVNGATGAKKTVTTREALQLPPPPSRRSSVEGLWTTKASPKSTVPISVTFVNQTDELINVYWFDYYGKPKSYGSIPPGGKNTTKTFQGHRWRFDHASTNKPLAILTAEEDGETLIIDGPPPKEVVGEGPAVSPDGKWAVRFTAERVTLVNRETKDSTDYDCAVPDNATFLGTVSWSPDSNTFMVPAVVEVARRRIHLIESSPKDSPQPKLEELEYIKPGDPLPKAVPVIFRVGESVGLVVADDLFLNPYQTDSNLRGRWSADGSEFYFDYNQRGHQLYRIIAVKARSGEARVVVEETSATFVDYLETWRHWLPGTGELIWKSERDGWKHLWLIDVASGAVKTQITHGEWVVRQVLHVDEEKRQVWFLACGLKAGEDPCQQHLCRVNLDGSGFIQLTEGDGEHEIQFSPNRRCFLDTWSRADAPPVHEWRLCEDGSKIAEIESVDVGELLATGWRMPERFVAKGRDGKTDIHGILIKPSHFDPTKHYPIVEQIYAGPPSSYAPKKFGILSKQHQLAELGFIVVQVDGMGTNDRGKAFHDVCWKNLKDAGFPDRIAWIKAAAATRPWMDLTRVGIYGGSAGGQSAMRALLDHHDFYHVAVADCGCHDNRMDKIWWNEQWMGWPVDESYARSSNVDDAHKLEGHLLLIVGEQDANVDPASTMQVVGALQKAGKTFEFMPIVGVGHGSAETPYGTRLRMEFLIKHLSP
jgi:dienelactone hydrolase